jgi:hypothetical protein
MQTELWHTRRCASGCKHTVYRCYGDQSNIKFDGGEVCPLVAAKHYPTSSSSTRRRPDGLHCFARTASEIGRIATAAQPADKRSRLTFRISIKRRSLFAWRISSGGKRLPTRSNTGRPYCSEVAVVLKVAPACGPAAGDLAFEASCIVSNISGEQVRAGDHPAEQAVAADDPAAGTLV